MRFLWSTTLLALSTAAIVDDVETWVRNKRKQSPYDVAPGVTATVTAQGLSRSFGDGVQRQGGPACDADTLMEIGSLSKTMISLGLSTLVTAKTLSFDDTVRSHLGANFTLGPHEYVSEVLTVRDLLTHRTGLAEGQGDVLSYFVPPPTATAQLRFLNPVHTLRSRFDYSNTGWTLAGEVLRAATQSASWCEALHTVLLQPLNLTRTYCHRNEVPADVAARHLAAVHKANPCAKEAKTPSEDAIGGTSQQGAAATAAAAAAVLPLATFDFVATGGPAEFAWGAADAAGSVISSAADMTDVIHLLLGVGGVGPVSSDPVISRAVVEELMTGQVGR